MIEKTLKLVRLKRTLIIKFFLLLAKQKKLNNEGIHYFQGD